MTWDEFKQKLRLRWLIDKVEEADSYLRAEHYIGYIFAIPLFLFIIGVLIFWFTPDLYLPRGFHEWGLIFGSMGTVITALLLYRNQFIQGRVLEMQIRESQPLFRFDRGKMSGTSGKEASGLIKVKNVGSVAKKIEINVLDARATIKPDKLEVLERDGEKEFSYKRNEGQEFPFDVDVAYEDIFGKKHTRRYEMVKDGVLEENSGS